MITPYWQDRHDYEIIWLKHFKFEVPASMCLGRDEQYLKYISEEDLIDAIKVANKCPVVDATYIACTFLPTLSIYNNLNSVSKFPLVTANQAIIEEVYKYL